MAAPGGPPANPLDTIATNVAAIEASTGRTEAELARIGDGVLATQVTVERGTQQVTEAVDKTTAAVEEVGERVDKTTAAVEQAATDITGAVGGVETAVGEVGADVRAMHTDVGGTLRNIQTLLTPPARAPAPGPRDRTFDRRLAAAEQTMRDAAADVPTDRLARIMAKTFGVERPGRGADPAVIDDYVEDLDWLNRQLKGLTDPEITLRVRAIADARRMDMREDEIRAAGGIPTRDPNDRRPGRVIVDAGFVPPDRYAGEQREPIEPGSASFERGVAMLEAATPEAGATRRERARLFMRRLGARAVISYGIVRQPGVITEGIAQELMDPGNNRFVRILGRLIQPTEGNAAERWFESRILLPAMRNVREAPQHIGFLDNRGRNLPGSPRRGGSAARRARSSQSYPFN